MNTRSLAAVVLTLAGWTGAAVAEDAPAPVGTETRAWLDLQSSNSAASPTVRPMPGDIADKVYQRHADSFAQPIPDSLGRDAFVSESGGE